MDGSALSFGLISIGAFIIAAAIRVGSGPDIGYVLLVFVGMASAMVAGFVQSHRQRSK